MAIPYLAKAPAWSSKEKSRAASENNIKILNVVGSRGSKEPGVAAFVRRALEEALRCPLVELYAARAQAVIRGKKSAS